MFFNIHWGSLGLIHEASVQNAARRTVGVLLLEESGTSKSRNHRKRTIYSLRPKPYTSKWPFYIMSNRNFITIVPHATPLNGKHKITIIQKNM